MHPNLTHAVNVGQMGAEETDQAHSLGNTQITIHKILEFAKSPLWRNTYADIAPSAKPI